MNLNSRFWPVSGGIIPIFLNSDTDFADTYTEINTKLSDYPDTRLTLI